MSCYYHPCYMARTIIKIEKRGSENSAGVMRRFSQAARESGVVKKVKDGRYAKRKASDFVTKKNALNRIKKSEIYKRLRKLGKIG